MTNTAKSPGILNAFSGSSTEEESEYRGKVFFNKRTVVFSGTTLQLKNIAQFEQYGVKYINKISIPLLILSAILAVGGAIYAPYGLVLTLVFGFIVYLGVKERMRPKLYGMTIELNSGTRHYFLNKDKSGIEVLFEKLSVCIEKEEPFVVSFVDNRVTITNANIGVVGDNATTFNTTFS